MTKTKNNTQVNFEQIIAELDQEASVGCDKSNMDEVTKRELFNKYFPELIEKGGAIAGMVHNINNSERNNFKITNEMIDGIQPKIDEMRLYIYGLGSARAVFDCWLGHVIPWLRDLERGIREAKEEKQEQVLVLKRKLLMREDGLLFIHKESINEVLQIFELEQQIKSLEEDFSFFKGLRFNLPI